MLSSATCHLQSPDFPPFLLTRDFFFFYLFPNTSALVFWPFFCTTSFRLKSFFISCRGARQRAETAWGRSSIRLSHGSIGGRGAPGFTPRWCRHWGNEKKNNNVYYVSMQTNFGQPKQPPCINLWSCSQKVYLLRIMMDDKTLSRLSRSFLNVHQYIRMFAVNVKVTWQLLNSKGPSIHTFSFQWYVMLL